jgi:tetratricopeptide (TPR) repeat protein/tRNA A-37 threonylcarbamoyl transferase component Bud32
MIRGKYRILGKLGQGGMATVYKALHVGFDEVCALKVINQELASDLSFVKRFGQEAALTRKLQHPNAVRVEDIDQADDGRPFMVMEFIEGESLKDVIQHQAPLPVPRACRIAKQVAAALDAAHRLGMIHRDIKPGNILLTRPAAGAGEELAKVLDFGIAKMKEAHLAAGAATLTRTGTSIGTPAYMSPEQAMGKTGEGLDGRADLYSLGVVMYEMLTGELPIQAESEVQMLIGQISTAPEPIRARRPELPDGIGAVVMRCLEKDPARRPASGAALIAQIENCEKGGAAGTAPDDVPTVATQRPAPLEAASPVPARRSSRFVWAAALVAFVVIAIVIAGGTWYLDSRRKQVARSPVAVPPVAASQPARQDRQIPTPPPAPAQPLRALTPAPTATKSPVPRPRADQDANPADDIQAALDAVPLDAATKAQVQGILRQATGLMKKGDFDGAAAQYQRLARLRPGWAPAIAALGAALAAKGISAGAAEQKNALNRTTGLTAAIARYNEALRLHPNVAINHFHLGKALGKLGDLKGDIREQQEALRLNPGLAAAHAQLGYIHSHKESWSDAAREYREAIRLKPDLAEAHSGLGDALGHMGDWQGEIAEERIAIQRAPSLAMAHFQLATALEHEGDSSTALEEYRRAAELDPREANFQANYKRVAREINAR